MSELNQFLWPPKLELVRARLLHVPQGLYAAHLGVVLLPAYDPETHFLLNVSGPTHRKLIYNRNRTARNAAIRALGMDNRYKHAIPYDHRPPYKPEFASEQHPTIARNPWSVFRAIMRLVDLSHAAASANARAVEETLKKFAGTNVFIIKIGPDNDDMRNIGSEWLWSTLPARNRRAEPLHRKGFTTPC